MESSCQAELIWRKVKLAMYGPNSPTRKSERQEKKLIPRIGKTSAESLMCIDPLNLGHLEGVVNIMSGIIGKAGVNVQNSLAIGKAQMEAFE